MLEDIAWKRDKLKGSYEVEVMRKLETELVKKVKGSEILECQFMKQ